MNEQNQVILATPGGWLIVQLRHRKQSAKADVCSRDCAIKFVRTADIRAV